ncbi:MAG: hypothetical protein EPN22_12585 [Nitrospirae bacterium]|nr:MAG: hypothetical protein EPN22_12585 [Nitrospirota bacterium]
MAKEKRIEVTQLTNEELISENLRILTATVGGLSDTLSMLVQKVENMAYHIIALEEVLGEVVSVTGVDLAKVNSNIRNKVSGGTGGLGDSSRAIDIAASIASAATRK